MSTFKKKISFCFKTMKKKTKNKSIIFKNYRILKTAIFKNVKKIVFKKQFTY